jgi:hypothetical protein
MPENSVAYSRDSPLLNQVGCQIAGSGLCGKCFIFMDILQGGVWEGKAETSLGGNFGGNSYKNCVNGSHRSGGSN